MFSGLSGFLSFLWFSLAFFVFVWFLLVFLKTSFMFIGFFLADERATDSHAPWVGIGTCFCYQIRWQTMFSREILNFRTRVTIETNPYLQNFNGRELNGRELFRGLITSEVGNESSQPPGPFQTLQDLKKKQCFEQERLNKSDVFLHSSCCRKNIS